MNSEINNSSCILLDNQSSQISQEISLTAPFQQVDKPQLLNQSIEDGENWEFENSDRLNMIKVQNCQPLEILENNNELQNFKDFEAYQDLDKSELVLTVNSINLSETQEFQEDVCKNELAQKLGNDIQRLIFRTKNEPQSQHDQ